MYDDGSGGGDRKFLRAVDTAEEPEFLMGQMEPEDDGESRN
jgi:hypothetical protein